MNTPSAHAAVQHDGAEHHVGARRTYYIVFASLMVLLFATVGIAYFDLGEWNIVVALTIAAVKAALIMLFFMHVIDSDRLIWIASCAALVWLAILVGLMMSDYLTRDVLGIAGK